MKLIAKFSTTLATGISTTSPTLTLASILTKKGETLSSGEYGLILDRGLSTEETIIGTLSGSTLTVVTRGVSDLDGTTSIAGNIYAHRKGATIELTGHPVFSNITSILDGTIPLSSLIKNPSSRTISHNRHIIDKEYADSIIAGLVGTASETAYGTSKLTVAPAAPGVPISVADNDPRVPTQAEKDALAGTSGTPSTSNKYVTNADTEGTGSVLRASKIAFIELQFGDGSDGDVIISGNTSLSRDMYYNNLTINNGFTLSPNGYRIFVKGTLTNNGTISTAGGNASGQTGGAAGGGTGSLTPGYVGGTGGAGRNGLTGADGGAGTSVSDSLGSNGAAGGEGGVYGAYTGGAGGAGGTATLAKTSPRELNSVSLMRNSASATFPLYTSSGGSGGGGGGGASSIGTGGNGGGAGGSGGVMAIYAKIIVNNGTITSAGGNGGNGVNSTGSNSGGGGGGAGGSGGVIVLVSSSYTNNGTVTVAAGAAGTFGTGQPNGIGGSAGTIGNVGVIYILTV